MSSIRCSFSCGLRGYHEYRSIWTPTLHEVLAVRHEPNNSYDRYAIACMKKLPSRLVESVVGHFPKEISRFTYYILRYGARVTAKVVDTHHRRSPLIQGGLEIPVEVAVEMDLTDKNRLCLEKYESLVNQKYQEPIDGSFDDATSAILRVLYDNSSNDEDSDVDLHYE